MLGMQQIHFYFKVRQFVHCPKSNQNFRDITRNLKKYKILHEIFPVVSRFSRSISCYISENQSLLGRCMVWTYFVCNQCCGAGAEGAEIIWQSRNDQFRLQCHTVYRTYYFFIFIFSLLYMIYPYLPILRIIYHCTTFVLQVEKCLNYNFFSLSSLFYMVNEKNTLGKIF